MGDLSLGQDFVDAIKDLLDESGKTRILKVTALEPIDPDDPGAALDETLVNYNVECILVDYEDSYVSGSNIEKGDRLAIISTSDLSFEVAIGMKLVDGSEIYKITNVDNPEVAGINPVALANIRR